MGLGHKAVESTERLMDWQADSIQGVIFTAPGEAQADAISLWAKLFSGETPEGFQKVTASPTGVTHATGLKNGNPITLTSQLGRIDIVAGPASEVVPTNHEPPPRIANVPEVANWIARYLMTLAETSRPIRAALVLDLGATVEPGHKNDALRISLGGVLPMGATDPVFQFNVPKTFAKLPDLTMNRLCTYTSGEMGFIIMGSPPALGGGPVATTPYIGLKIDVNTAADTRIPASFVNIAIGEMLSEALAIRRLELARFDS